LGEIIEKSVCNEVVRYEPVIYSVARDAF